MDDCSTVKVPSFRPKHDIIPTHLQTYTDTGRDPSMLYFQHISKPTQTLEETQACYISNTSPNLHRHWKRPKHVIFPTHLQTYTDTGRDPSMLYFQHISKPTQTLEETQACYISNTSPNLHRHWKRHKHDIFPTHLQTYTDTGRDPSILKHVIFPTHLQTYTDTGRDPSMLYFQHISKPTQTLEETQACYISNTSPNLHRHWKRPKHTLEETQACYISNTPPNLHRH
ncbi:hypothetical protein CHS0354_011742 [Potamilus streckersoni]|uniref:Uncharacterized protein n=1 Tax=Potamilus streckersoni TaxID=2493646 RepID=A0AAE0W3I1_9BIVA|nr:hypothetical protein CHS0354_011742 [Potamilus streckersoni]